MNSTTAWSQVVSPVLMVIIDFYFLFLAPDVNENLSRTYAQPPEKILTIVCNLFSMSALAKCECLQGIMIIICEDTNQYLVNVNEDVFMSETSLTPEGGSGVWPCCRSMSDSHRKL